MPQRTWLSSWPMQQHVEARTAGCEVLAALGLPYEEITTLKSHKWPNKGAAGKRRPPRPMQVQAVPDL